jgi:uncharacterized membrane protein
MSRKTIGYVVTIIGLILLVITTLADYIGLGFGAPNFGLKQIIGIVAAIIITLVGIGIIFLARKK